MLVIGIDPGTAITGFGVIDEFPDKSLHLVEHGVIRTTNKMNADQRLQILHEKLTEILCTYQPQCAAVEKLYFQRNVRTALNVGQARGVIMLALAQKSIPVFEYNPMDVKLAVTGYGLAEKRQVQQMVKALLCLEEIPKPDDAADALAIAICHAHSAKLTTLGM
ncbi:MAG: crossover junction endodeoxyribonuclease RuvC [Anaerolineaceae bacterium]